MTNGEFVTKDMSNEKHTPGPWRVEKHSQGYNLVRPGATQEYLTVYPEDDARLIAAAPELLAALRGMLSRYAPMGSGDNQQVADARAAIEKAGG